MTREFSSAEALRAGIGAELGPSESLVVDQARIDAFADATGDHQWIHVDPVRAAAGPYGTTIAHGYLTLSLIPHFGPQLFRIEFGSARLNYGLDKVRFPAPVPVGSALRARATVLAAEPSPAGITVRVRYTLQVDGAAKPACVAETLVVVVGEGATA